MDFSGWVPPEIKLLVLLIFGAICWVGYHIGAWLADHISLSFH